MKSTAYKAGFEGGGHARTDAEVMGTIVDRECLEQWFRPGQETPDVALINALGMAETAECLGVTSTEGPAWERALEEYNAGFEAGVRDES